MELENEVLIAVPAPQAWELIGERFGAISEWAAPIVASSLDAALGVGAVRTCNVAAFGPVPAGVVRERLVAFAPTAMSFSYEAVSGMPGFIARAINTWSVVAAGTAVCRVRTKAQVDLRWPARLLGPLFKWQFGAGGERVLGELKHQLEQGRPHPRKVAAADHASRHREPSLQGK